MEDSFHLYMFNTNTMIKKIFFCWWLWFIRSLKLYDHNLLLYNHTLGNLTVNAIQRFFRGNMLIFSFINWSFFRGISFESKHFFTSSSGLPNLFWCEEILDVSENESIFWNKMQPSTWAGQAITLYKPLHLWYTSRVFFSVFRIEYRALCLHLLRHRKDHYKGFMIVNYGSRVIIWGIFVSGSTLKELFMIKEPL